MVQQSQRILLSLYFPFFPSAATAVHTPPLRFEGTGIMKGERSSPIGITPDSILRRMSPSVLPCSCAICIFPFFSPPPPGPRLSSSLATSHSSSPPSPQSQMNLHNLHPPENARYACFFPDRAISFHRKLATLLSGSIELASTENSQRFFFFPDSNFHRTFHSLLLMRIKHLPQTCYFLRSNSHLVHHPKHSLMHKQTMIFDFTPVLATNNHYIKVISQNLSVLLKLLKKLVSFVQPAS
jgi:hypothetical protein